MTVAAQNPCSALAVTYRAATVKERPELSAGLARQSGLRPLENEDTSVRIVFSPRKDLKRHKLPSKATQTVQGFVHILNRAYVPVKSAIFPLHRFLL